MSNQSLTPLPFESLPGPRRRPKLGTMVITLGLALMVAGVAAPALGYYMPLNFDITSTEPTDISTFTAFLIPGLIALYSGVFLIGLGRRMRAMPALQLLAVDTRPPVLFLRSFQDDDLLDPTPRMIPFGNFFPRRYEESLVQPLSRLGPVVSIGRPGNKFAMLGGARLFVMDEVWREAVGHLRDHAVAVIVLVGRTEGLWWEVETSLRRVPHERLLFFFPYVEEQRRRTSIWQRVFHFRSAQVPLSKGAFERTERERQGRYVLFRERIQSLLSVSLPESLGTSQFLHFESPAEVKRLPTIRPWWSWVAFHLPSLRKMTLDMRRTLAPFVKKLGH